MKRRVSLAEVAGSAGVSLGTVSNVLHAPDRVRSKTRDKVYRAMRELGYRPPGIVFPSELASITPRDGDTASVAGTKPMLVVAGYISVDYIARIDVMPHRDDRMTAERIAKELGGPAANVAVAAAALGGNCALDVELATAIGEDPDSLWALQKLAERGVRARAVRDPFRNRLSRCIVMVERSGHRTKINEPFELSEADLIAYLPPEVPKRPCHLHIEGYQAERILPAIPDLRRRGWTASLHDTGLADAYRSAAGFAGLLVTLDTVFLNRRSAAELLGRSLPTDALIDSFAAFLDQRTRDAEVVVTLGIDGAAVFPVDGGPPIRVASLAVEVLDGTGAGDCFVGSYLAQRLCGQHRRVSAERACAAASLTMAAEGAQGRRSSLSELEALVSETAR